MAVSKKFRWTNADGESMEVDIGADGENVTVNGQPLDVVLDGKADRQTEGGGFIGGNGASASSSGVAIGKSAKVSEGSGTAIGNLAKSVDSGLSIGSSSISNGNSVAVGSGAEAIDATAVGYNAQAKDGIAIGQNAKATGYNSIQIGAGTNPNDDTLQIRRYQLLNEDGHIPEERLPENFQNLIEYSSTPVQVGTWIDSTPVWRVAIPMTSVSEISLNTNNKSWSIRSDQILDRLSIINDTSNFIHIDSMIRFQNSNDYDPEAFATGWTEMFPGYFNGEAENVDYATHFYGWIEFALPASSVSAV